MGIGPREVNWRHYGFAASAITVGAAFVTVGVWAIKRPADFPRVIGASAGALSAPLYLPLVGLGHPNDAGVDIGRGFVGIALPAMLPLNMWIGAKVGQCVAERRRTESWIGTATPGARTAFRMSARAIGLGAVALSALILWQAVAESSTDPEVANWEIIHHGVLPAVPIAAVGVCTFLLTSWFPVMCGALLGTFPALLCSSLLVDPDPGNHGQVPEALLAYSLPVTLPTTVGLAVLAVDRIERRIREFRERRS